MDLIYLVKSSTILEEIYTTPHSQREREEDAISKNNSGEQNYIYVKWPQCLNSILSSKVIYLAETSTHRITDKEKKRI